MLSYQHLYHAGNLADVHKHALLAWLLDYLTAKDKPLSYLESHAGRGLYDLAAPEALKTGEAAAGIGRLETAFDAAHPYRRALARVRAEAGPSAYPGSPGVAAALLRPDDTIHLFERHPQELAALRVAMRDQAAHVHGGDGFAGVLAMTPPTPRRGVLLVDPSYETASDYEGVPKFLGHVARKWNVGVLMLWYPLLVDGRHAGMLAALQAAHGGALRHEVRFRPARPGHGMVGSGVFVVNPPWGMSDEAARLTALFARAGV